MTWTTQPRFEFGQLAAIQKGEGKAILLLHGVGLRAEAWNGQTSELATNYHVIAPDMPGHGMSAMLPGNATLARYTDRIAAALNDSITSSIVVAGHSMGAMIALDLACRYPERVRGVAALNAIYRRSPEAAAAVQKRASSLDGRTVADPSGPLKRWFQDDESPEASACLDWLTSVNPGGYKTAYSIFAHSDAPPDASLMSLACPALFMTGAEEPNSTPAMSEEMAALVPGGRAIVLDGAAHMMPMTHPAAVNAALTQFIAECQS
ncbi:MAG: alpha/beta hydrolase [Pseudomonadota bacterium]